MLTYSTIRCAKCGVGICSEKCCENEYHLLECDILASRKARNENEFQDFELLSPLRFLAMKSKHPEKYAKLRTLMSHLDSKVNLLV